MTTAAVAVTVLLLGTAGVARSQSAAEHVAAGNNERDARNASAALQHYEAAIAADPNEYDALRNAAYECVDLGEFEPSAERRTALYRSAEQYARRAVAANPQRRRRSLSARASARPKRADDGRARQDQVGGRGARASARRARDRPKHAGALHVMGVWNAEVMRLNGFSRA